MLAVVKPPFKPLVLALVLPACLALLATMCSGTPPALIPVPPAPSTDAGLLNPSWAVPGVEIARPRTVILLAPPPGAPDAAGIRAIAPDPPPLTEQAQWVYDLRYDKGELSLGGVHRTLLPAPQATPRVMGRFALELYSGPTLIERVRFDFPGLGGAEKEAMKGPDGGKRQPLHGGTFSFTAKISTRVGVMLPATVRGSRLELWDRATNQRWPLPWPAVETTTLAPETPDASIASP